MKKALSYIFIVVFSFSLLTACTTTNPYTGEKETSGTAIGTGIGVVGGAVLGGIFGGNATSVLIGAAAGGVLGGVLGHHHDEKDDQLAEYLRKNGVIARQEGPHTIKLVMPKLNFKDGSAEIPSSGYEPLHAAYIVIKHYSDTYVKITGHGYDYRLAKDRADNVKAYLMAQDRNFNASRFTVNTDIKERPKQQTNTQEQNNSGAQTALEEHERNDGYDGKYDRNTAYVDETHTVTITLNRIN